MPGYAAYEMLRRLKLEVKFHTSTFRDDVMKTRYQKAISRALWGICCFERYVASLIVMKEEEANTWRLPCSISAFSYLQPAIVRVPGIPRRFVDDGGIDPEVIGRSEAARESHVSAYVLNAFCDLSEMLYGIMDWNEKQRDNLGGHLDVETRMDFYQDLCDWNRSLSPFIRAESNFTLGTCFLR